ncbi:MAG: GMC family oxidoreductase [Bdellovibrionales bacterium]|nr:GMC family oxidoreductase [Bdellovibrionales bacterium]
MLFDKDSLYNTDPIEEIREIHWDYIVVGTGIGGSCSGYLAAKTGAKVLFLEKGYPPQEEYKGLYPEEKQKKITQNFVSTLDPIEALKSNRSHEVFFKKNNFQRYKPFTPFLGSGPGGSSALYGMVMERFLEENIAPISMEEFQLYYEKAEQLFSVKKGEELPPLNSHLEKISAQFAAIDIPLYRLPLAYRADKDCEYCQSYLCNKNCKVDASIAALQPALEFKNCKILYGVLVKKIFTDSSQVKNIQISLNGIEETLNCKYLLLAAGGLQSPIILLNSKNTFWPQGVGNQNNNVGKYLTRHLIDLYVFNNFENLTQGYFEKSFGSSIFYQKNKEKYGTFQSFGKLPPGEMLWNQTLLDINEFYFYLTKPLLSLVKNTVVNYLNNLRLRLCMSSIMEDTPSRDNSLFLIEKKPVIQYKITPEDLQRLKKFRKLLAAKLKPLQYRRLDQAHNITRLAHASGTCRMSDHESTGVVGSDYKVFGINNLFILDSSILPKSGGTNPSLTIAAHSIRWATQHFKRFAL